MRGLAFACALFALGGCSLVLDTGRHTGGGDGGMDTGADTGPPITPLSVGNVCPSLARVLCLGRETCCSMANPPDCQATLRASCEDGLGPILLEENANYDDVRAAEILADAEAMAMMCDPSILGLVGDRDGLLSALRGMFDAGEPCESALTDDLLQRAINRHFTCTEGNGCRTDDLGAFVCAPLADVDEPCASDFECGNRLYCSGLDLCATRLPDGTDCDRANQCTSLFCDVDGTGRCAAPMDDDVWCADPFGILDRGPTP